MYNSDLNIPSNTYNYVPTTVNGNQFLSYRQPGYYFTDFRPSSDYYSYLIHEASGKGVLTGHQLRQYMQDNGEILTHNFLNTTSRQFTNMMTIGPPNSCYGNEHSVIYSGGKILKNSQNVQQKFEKQCSTPGQTCLNMWENTPLPQQGPHCGLL